MKTALKIGMGLLMLGLVLSNTPVFAKPGGGGGHEGGGPAGFDHGEKKGWKGEDVPPGWEHGEKKGWHGESSPPGQMKKTREDAKKEGKKEKEK
ncbi:MAG: hypothetical protein HYZ83_08375 [Candidatus Omnitrophica bacterium]|nr:hypothetical protein [Candidatus Omnitrophota bacterium]